MKEKKRPRRGLVYDFLDALSCRSPAAPICACYITNLLRATACRVVSFLETVQILSLDILIVESQGYRAFDTVLPLMNFGHQTRISVTVSILENLSQTCPMIGYQ